jgi:hypothetical protein
MDEDSRLGLYADLGCVRKGDTVFFYQRRIDEPRAERGFRGIYEVIEEPFFDDLDLEWEGNVVRGKCPHCKNYYSEKPGDDAAVCPSCRGRLNLTEHILPNRVLIKPKEYYESPVDDNTAYIDRTDPGTLWTMLFRKIYGPGRERSVTPILPEEAEKLVRLLRRVNDNKTASFPSKPYRPTMNPININLGSGPTVPYENTLLAWMTRNIDKDYPTLREVVGPVGELEFFGDQVLYGIGGEKVDLLCLHKRDNIRYKATVFELKKDSLDQKSVTQISDYSYWIAQLVTANLPYPVENFVIQPVLIGYRVAKKALNSLQQMDIKKFKIPYQKPCEVTIHQPIVITYSVSNGSINFQIQHGLLDFI